MKRTIAVAVATVGVAGALQHVVFPQHDYATPHSQQRELQRQYATSRQRELEQRYRVNIDGPTSAAAEQAEERSLARDLEKDALRSIVP